MHANNMQTSVLQSCKAKLDTPDPKLLTGLKGQRCDGGGGCGRELIDGHFEYRRWSPVEPRPEALMEKMGTYFL